MKNKFNGLVFGFIALALMVGAPSLVFAAPDVTSIAPNFGPTAGGTAVTITGTGFEGVVTVTVGGVAATAITVVGPTSITATTPAGTAGAQDVVITNTTTGPGTDTLVGGFTYLVASSPAAVDLGTAGDFVILSKTGITTTGVTDITGDLGVSPIDSTAVTGFGLALDSSNTFSTSSLVTGRIYASDYTDPTPSMLTTAVSDMEAAYTAALVPATTVLNAGSGNIGGMTLPAGVYTFGTAVTIPSDLTLNGSSSDVWIFQISGNLSIASATDVLLTGGATADNVFWAVAGTTTLGTTSAFKGTILGGPATTAIAIQTDATLIGKALGQKEVTLGATTTVTTPVASDPKILVAGVTGLVAPERNATPALVGSLTTGAGTYTVTDLSWSPANNPFNSGTAYTATIELTSAAGYKFPITGIAVPTVDVSGTVSAGVTAGGNVSGNTLTFTVLFLETSSPSSGGSRSGGNKTTPSVNSPVSCPPGQMFSTVTGQRCTSVSSSNLVFCPKGQMFNTTNGERCNTVSDSTAPGASGYTFGFATIRQGTKGEACRAWQRFFNDKAGANLATDGNCGPLTMNFAKNWQVKMGLVSDGLLGPASRSKALAQ